MSDLVFVSYARTDSEFAKQLVLDLKSAGVTAWMDQVDIPAGARWDESIAAALRDADFVLVILTPESARSQNVLDEIGFALSNEKRVVPLIYKACEVPFRIARLQRFAFTEDYQQCLQALASFFREYDLSANAVASPPSQRGVRTVPLRQVAQISLAPTVAVRSATKSSPMLSSEKLRALTVAAVAGLGVSVLLWYAASSSSRPSGAGAGSPQPSADGNAQTSGSGLAVPPSSLNAPVVASLIGGRGIDAFDTLGEDGLLLNGRFHVDSMPFAFALRATRKLAPPSDKYRSQWSAANLVPIKSHDLLQVTFYSRCLGKSCQSEFVFEKPKNDQDYKRYYCQEFRPTTNWFKHSFTFTVDEGISEKGAYARFRLGLSDQTLEIGGIDILVTGSKQAPANSPPSSCQ